MGKPAVERRSSQARRVISIANRREQMVYHEGREEREGKIHRVRPGHRYIDTSKRAGLVLRGYKFESACWLSHKSH